jgi:phosphoglycerol transferase MdoB-like AlkP superfamily enzyme
MAFNQKASYAEKVYALLKSVWLVLFWLVLLLMASRLAMFYSFVSPEELIGHEQDVVRMWIMGLRYDARVCALMLAPIFVLGLILCVGYRSWRFFLRLATLLFACSFFIPTLFAIVNYYYYETYHNYIDIFVFGLAGEDKGAVLQNIWQDYPVPSVILALFLLTLLPVLLVRRILRRPEQARACVFTPPPPAVRPMLFAFFV